MKYTKIYSNRILFDAYSNLITRKPGAYTSDEFAEAIRIRKKKINIENVAQLVHMSDNDLKALKGAALMAEELAKTTNEVPRLCDL